MLMKLGVDIGLLKRPMRRALDPLDILYKRHDDEFVIWSKITSRIKTERRKNYVNESRSGHIAAEKTNAKSAETIRQFI